MLPLARDKNLVAVLHAEKKYNVDFFKLPVYFYSLFKTKLSFSFYVSIDIQRELLIFVIFGDSEVRIKY